MLIFQYLRILIETHIETHIDHVNRLNLNVQSTSLEIYDLGNCADEVISYGDDYGYNYSGDYPEEVHIPNKQLRYIIRMLDGRHTLLLF